MSPFWCINWLTFIVFYSLIPVVVYINGNFNYYWDYLQTKLCDNDPNTVFDFIVVGSGSSGSVIANRLSKNNKVLLLEAGGDPLYHNSIPGLAPNMVGQPFVDWNYYTVPQKHSSFSMIDHRSFAPRGKALGGSSVLNYMLYVRGHPLDYDKWANLTDNPEWNYENVLPYFKKSLDYHGEFSTNDKHYGKTPYGYLHVEEQHHKPLHQPFMEAGMELGYKIVDANGPQASGFGVQEVTQKYGKRFSSYDAFIKHFQSRENLRISRYSQAIKVHIDKNNRATGIWYVKHGQKRFARASKEIIISCGAIGSPTLLMHSGIGPKQHLQSLKIPNKINLPVGNFLKDHISINIMPFVVNQSVSWIPERDFGIGTLLNYYLNGKGPLTVPVDAYSQAFISSSEVLKTGVDWPNLQLYMLSLGAYETIADDFALAYNVKPGIFEAMFEPVQGKDMFILMATLARPKSFGSLKLASNNVFDPPLIDPNYLQSKDDVAALVEAIKFCIKLGSGTKSFAKLGSTFVDVPIPGCEHHAKRSDAFWECYVRHHARTLYHPVGTCRMGKNAKDPKAVVDSHLRVLGVKGLRVADASIMPELVNGNTHAPSSMIGEKASEFIRRYWSEQLQVCTNNFNEIIKKRTINQKCFYAKLV